MNAQSLLVLDLEKCTRCDELPRPVPIHTTRDPPDSARPALRQVSGSQLLSLMSGPLLHGRLPGRLDPPRDSREIIIEDWCIGCGKCADNCPYGNINMHGFQELRPDPADPARKVAVVQQKATTCDLCSGLDGPTELRLRLPPRTLPTA